MKKQEIHGILKSDDVRHDRKAVLCIGIMKGGIKMRAFLASMLGRLVMFIVCYAVAFGIVFGVAALASSMDIPFLMLIVLVPIIICGWHFIDWLTPAMFVWMSWAGWAIYFVIKLMASCFLGFFIAPYHIAKTICDNV